MDNETQDTDLVKKLRADLDRITAERDELRGFKRETVLHGQLREFGLDPEKGPGRLAAQAYDGDLTADAVTSWLDEQGFERTTSEQSAPEGMAARVEQREKLTAIEGQSAPAEGQKISKDELSALLKKDPQAGLRAHAEGRVEWPSAAAASTAPANVG